MINTKSISSIVYAEVADFKNRQIITEEKNDKYFSQYENIIRINLYLQDEFVDRDDGIFWNLSTPRIPHFAKNIDLDTKDFYPYAVGVNSFTPNWILKMKYYAWARESKFGLLLNSLSEGVSTYGSMVQKKIYLEDGDPSLKTCNLSNLYFDQSAETIREANVVELHYFSETELRKRSSDWDNVDQVIKKGRNDVKEGEFAEYEIWERWGEFEEAEDDVKYKHYIGYGEGDKEIIMLEEDEKMEDMPYYDFHLSQYTGRWQRIGVVERLYSLQERTNELVNQNAKTTEIASMLLLRSQDVGMDGNVLTGVESGQIITSTDLQQIAIQNPGLNNFIQELQLIEQQADKLCMTPAVMTGQKTPAGMPFRGMALLSEAAKNTFDFIRETVAIKLVDILLDEILPEIVKDWNKGELLDIAGDEAEVEIYDQSIKRRMKMDAILKGQLITPEFEDKINTMADERISVEGRGVKIPKGYFDFEYKIRINPTGESFDLNKQNDAYNNALQLVLQNPAILEIPLFRQYLENNGIEWEKLKPEQQEALTEGALGAPAQPAPVPNQTPEMALQ